MPTYTGSKAQSGRGSIVNIGGITGAAGGTEVFTLLGEVRSAPLTGSQWQQENVTNFESGSDEEFINTIRSPGETTIMLNRVTNDAGQLLVTAAYNDGLARDFQVILPVNTKVGQTTVGDMYSFSALVLSDDVQIEPTKAITLTIKLKISGPRTFTAGS
jgi:hypothetical protein